MVVVDRIQCRQAGRSGRLRCPVPDATSHPRSGYRWTQAQERDLWRTRGVALTPERRGRGRPRAHAPPHLEATLLRLLERRSPNTDSLILEKHVCFFTLLSCGLNMCSAKRASRPWPVAGPRPRILGTMRNEPDLNEYMMSGRAGL